MATERRHRRSSKGKPNKTTTRRRSKKTEEPQAQAAGPTTSVHDVPDHVLQLVLLRLDSSASLLRAAAACKLWRRTIADTGFLARFGALHAPCVAGHYHAFDPDWLDYGLPPVTGNPVFLPSSSSSSCNNSTTNVVDSRRFSLDDFLPESKDGWNIADSRGSLLLLFKRIGREGSRYFPDLLVCDPLTRRKQGILSPDEIAYYCLGVFLLDGGDDGHAEGSGSGTGTGITSGGRVDDLSNFRVVSVLHEYLEAPEPEGCKPVACVFTPGIDGGWRVLPSASTNSDGIILPDLMESISFAGRVNGSLYWALTGEGGGAMLVLDEATLAFSRIAFPAGSSISDGSYDKWSFRVIGGGGDDGKLPRVVRTINSHLKIFARQQGSEEWVVQKSLKLREAAGKMPGCEDLYWYFQRNAMILAAHETYVLITPQEKTCVFSVELETMEVEREHERNRYPGPAYPCELPWLPVLEACAAADDHGRRRRRR